MNDITLLREAGPEAPVLSTATRATARAALLDEIAASRTARGRLRRRLPSRKVTVRVGLAAVAVVAAWTTAAVVAAPDGPGRPADSVTLVGFRMPTFPLSLDPVPDGLRPFFDGDGDGAQLAVYQDAADQNGFDVAVAEDEPDRPDEGADGYRVASTGEVTVQGHDAELVRYSRRWCTGDLGTDCPRRAFTWLSWERHDGQWVSILAHGRYRPTAKVLAIADSLVDRPQPAALDVGLAPAGWSVQFYKMGRVLTLVNDADEQQTLTVHIPLPEDVVPPDQLLHQLAGPLGPVTTVSVHGRPAQLVLVDGDYRDEHLWYLQAQFDDGTTYTLQVPDAFTRQQVVEFAEQVTHTP
jgi:hypothetical protein